MVRALPSERLGPQTQTFHASLLNNTILRTFRVSSLFSTFQSLVLNLTESYFIANSARNGRKRELHWVNQSLCLDTKERRVPTSIFYSSQEGHLSSFPLRCKISRYTLGT